MAESSIYTAEQFLEARLDMPDAGRWTELNQGTISELDPPDVQHGTIVLNFSKVLSAYLHKANQGYACFEPGLLVKRDPDTVHFPAACIFLSGDRFAETDNAISERKPAVVLEVASTNPRRHLMSDHVSNYVEWGVDLIWVIDPQTQDVLEYPAGGPSQIVAVNEKISGGNVLPEFSMQVEDLFKEPDWW